MSYQPKRNWLATVFAPLADFPPVPLTAYMEIRDQMRSKPCIQIALK